MRYRSSATFLETPWLAIAIGPDCLVAGVRVCAGGAAAGAAAMLAESAPLLSCRMVTVFTFFGSVAEVGGGGDTSGATACAEGWGAVTRGAGPVGSDTGCSSRGTTRSGAAKAPMRSWIGLLSTLAVVVGAGTVLGGVGSALITGGFPGALPLDVNAR